MSIEVSACVGEHAARSGGQPARRARIRGGRGGQRDGAGGRTCQRTGGKGSGKSAAKRRSQDSHQFVPQLSLRRGAAPESQPTYNQPASRASDLVEVFRGNRHARRRRAGSATAIECAPDSSTTPDLRSGKGTFA